MAQNQNPATPRLFLLEFNELCPALLSEFMGRRLLPNFRRLYDSSTVYVTDADEQHPNLEPWIQWLTVHSGLTYQEHGAFRLGDGSDLNKKCLAELLSDAGVRVGVFGSMNTNYQKLNGYLIPDAWDGNRTASPPRLQTFSSIVSKLVQDSSKESSGSKSDLVRLGMFLIQNGLSCRTAYSCFKQLWNEFRDSGLRWRRAACLDHINYDIFQSLNRRFEVQFATLFCNSVAHFQHYYWRNMEPEIFSVSPSESDHHSLQEAILFGYQSLDRIIGRLMDDSPNAVLVLCTALSQQPWTETTKCTYRPKRFEDLLEFAEIPIDSSIVKPVMAEEFHLQFEDDRAAEFAYIGLNSLELEGSPLMRIEHESNSLFAGCAIVEQKAPETQIQNQLNGRNRKFGDLFQLVHSMRSGRHHPDGVLWVRNGHHQIIEEKVPLTAIAPTILDYFSVEQPGYMEGAPLADLEHATMP